MRKGSSEVQAKIMDLLEWIIVYLIVGGVISAGILGISALEVLF